MLSRLAVGVCTGGLRSCVKLHCGRPSANLQKIIKDSYKPVAKVKCKIVDYSKAPAFLALITASGIGAKWLIKPAYCDALDTVKVRPAKFDWGRFLKLLLADIWSFLGAVVAALIVAYFNIQIPLYLGKIVNVMGGMIKNENMTVLLSQMKGESVKLIMVYVGQALATMVYISLLSGVGERMASKLRCDLFEAIMRQDMSFFDEMRTGELVDCLTTDVQEFKSAFKQCISQGLRSITQIAGCLVSLFIISPTMTATMLVVVPSMIVTGTLLGSLLRSISRRAQEQGMKAITLSEECISNMRTVRAFANEDKECRQFKQEVDEACRLNIKLGLGIGFFQAGTNLFLNGLVLGTLYLGGHLMLTENLTPGSLMSFLVATQTIQRSLAQLSLLFGHYIKGKQAGARVFEFTNLKSKIPLTGGKRIEAHSFIPSVEFKDVTFAYPNRPGQVILRGLNLSLPPGKTVAIVGSSGNGKSTIAALLERFYDVDAGSILVGGCDIRDLDPKWLRGSAIALINQEPVLFATSVRENIRYGCPEASDQQVYEAAKLANADDFITAFPEGYNTILGERGVTVSGGQKQRIAIARALIKNPAILILDEATSALDTESEKIVQQTLERVCKGRTVMVIAHRLSTVQNADVIVVLHKGVIVEIGNHKTLSSKNGHYSTLMNQQKLTAEDRERG